ncbi:MAG: glycosyltransferase [Culturomica sp.]|nr:glycosyltransferase [Culturomica sp.]
MIEVILSELGSYIYFFLCCIIFMLIYIAGNIYNCIQMCRKNKNPEKQQREGISVVITVNNKSWALRENLQNFMEQEHEADYEVIVVDECSEDDTHEMLMELTAKYPNLRTTRISPENKFRNTKKLAINLGMLAAHNDIVILADINSRPATPYWASMIEQTFDEKTVAVVGYANFKETKIIDIPKIFRFAHFVERYLLIKNRIFVIGEGYNMACRKKAYLSTKVFCKNPQSLSGFDHEIITSLAKLGNIKNVKETKAEILLDEDVRFDWKESMAYYYNNKRGWKSVALLQANYLIILRWAIYVMAFYLLLLNILPMYNSVIILLTFVTGIAIMGIELRQLQQKHLFLSCAIAQCLGFFYRWYFSVYSIFTYKKWR